MKSYVLVLADVNNGRIETIIGIFFDSVLAEREKFCFEAEDEISMIYDNGDSLQYEVHEHELIGEPL